MPFPTKQLARLKSKKAVDLTAIRWNAFLASGEQQTLPGPQSDSEATAALSYTGGTTGESKGVMLTNRAGNVLALHYRISDAILDFCPGQTFMGILPPFYAYGLFLGLHMPLCTGMQLILCPDPSPEQFPKGFVKYRPNHFLGGPMHIESLTNAPKIQKLNLSFLITAGFGGDKVTEEWEGRITAFLDSHHAPYGLCNGYGMTETAGAFCTTSHKLKDMIPFVKNNIKIIDVDSGEELSYGHEGEVCVSGPTLMRGYYEHDKETSDVLWTENGVLWFHTGDLGYVTEEGHFIISGRLKRVSWTRGVDGIVYRVYPMKIEKTLSKCQQVRQCCVVEKADKQKGFIFVAFVSFLDGANRDDEISKMKSLCKMELPETFWPSEYRVVEFIPVTRAGKIDYRALEKMAEEIPQA